MKKLFLSAVAAMLAVTSFSQKLKIKVTEYNRKDSSIIYNNKTYRNNIKTDSDWTFDLDNFKLYYKHNLYPEYNVFPEGEIIGVKQRNGIYTITYLDCDLIKPDVKYTNVAIIDTNKETFQLKFNEQERGFVIFSTATKLKMSINKHS